VGLSNSLTDEVPAKHRGGGKPKDKDKQRSTLFGVRDEKKGPRRRGSFPQPLSLQDNIRKGDGPRGGQGEQERSR